MNIRLRSVVPRTIPKAVVESSEVWARELVWEEGDSILVEATSGKGKSTLLHLLYGLFSDYTGECLLENLPPAKWNRSLVRSQTLSLLFQDLRLFNHLSARENLLLLPEIDETAPTIEEMSDRLEVNSLLDRPVQSLSFGQRQRFALMRCLRKPFRWLLLDEPFSHLDEQNARRASQLIEETLLRTGAGMILTALNSDGPLIGTKSFKL